MVEQLKGQPILVACLFVDSREIVLLRYPDQRWAIQSDSISLGVWENDEWEDCLGFFLKFLPPARKAPSINMFVCKNIDDLQRLNVVSYRSTN